MVMSVLWRQNLASRIVLTSILNGKTILVILCLRRCKKFQIRSVAHAYSTVALMIPAEVLLLTVLLKLFYVLLQSLLSLSAFSILLANLLMLF